jgi:hypothetical protein
LKTRATFTAGQVQPIPGLAHLLWHSSGEDLAGLIQHDPQLIEALDEQFQVRLSQLSLDEFTRTCVLKIAPSILRAIDHCAEVQPWTRTESAVAGMAIDHIVSDLLDYLGLPATRTLACTALVILFIKGWHAQGPVDPQTKPGLHIQISPRWPYLRISVAKS